MEKKGSHQDRTAVIRAKKQTSDFHTTNQEANQSI
jgi:hypothetical protein